MTRFRKVRKYENGWVIRLLQQDIDDLNIKDGDLIDIEDAVFHCSIPQELESKFVGGKNEIK
jgi:hypothetical protein